MPHAALRPLLSGKVKPVIGMVHLRPLPGSPGNAGDFDAVRRAALRDAESLVEAGVPALMMENFGDTPFFPGQVPAVTVACMTAIAAAIRERHAVPLGINTLRNDGCSALSIAVAVGASFVRVNVLSGARLADQGIIQGIAHELLRLRANLGAEGVAILADVDVKHSAPLAAGAYRLEDEVHDVIERGGADAVIASGAGTGRATDMGTLRRVKEAARDTPVLVGSGVTPENAAEYAELADILIVGSSLKKDGRVTNPVDPKRVRKLMQSLRAGVSPHAGSGDSPRRST
jgi:membrane complex biogenesis BtpA family protein